MCSTVASKRVASTCRLEEAVERLSEQQAEAMKMARFAGMTISEMQEYCSRSRRSIAHVAAGLFIC